MGLLHVWPFTFVVASAREQAIWDSEIEWKFVCVPRLAHVRFRDMRFWRWHRELEEGVSWLITWRYSRWGSRVQNDCGGAFQSDLHLVEADAVNSGNSHMTQERGRCRVYVG